MGIELIGRHLASLPALKLTTLLERLEAQRFQAVALRQVPPEMPYQDNLEAAFELSWQLLNEDAKQLGGLLSVFALAPIVREWVVTSLSNWDEELLEAAEAALLRKSLVSFDQPTAFTNPRVFRSKTKRGISDSCHGVTTENGRGNGRDCQNCPAEGNGSRFSADTEGTPASGSGGRTTHAVARRQHRSSLVIHRLGTGSSGAEPMARSRAMVSRLPEDV